MKAATNPTSITIRIVLTLLRHRRITVRKLQDEIGLSRRSTYRWLERISTELPLRLCDGVVCLEDEQV